ncbi:MAG: L-seryl-tRNA(Sec) selenium transferase, partial [Clostridia bacterium]
MARPVKDGAAGPGAESLRRLPSIHTLAGTLPAEIAAVWRVEAAQAAVAESRERIGRGEDPEQVLAAIVPRARELVDALARPRLRPVINATGVVLHTNLGRAPLGDEVVAQVGAIAAGYSTLEYDAERGTRGSRHVHVEQEITAITGAEAAMAVNNNAAAVFLALSELARGR